MDAKRLAKVRRLTSTGVARAIRQEAGLSLAEIAEAAGIDRSTAFRWETGQRRPRSKAALRYLDVLEDLVDA